MSNSHYLNRPYNNLPNYYGYQYLIPDYAAWKNYTVPFWTPPGYFYEPHYYYPRNDSDQVQNVVCKQTPDQRYCPINAGVVQGSNNVSMCVFGDRKITSERDLSSCTNPISWPAEYTNQ